MIFVPQCELDKLFVSCSVLDETVLFIIISKICSNSGLDINDAVHYDHMQTRHNFVGEIRIFSVKICINPYPSFMHRCIAKTFTRFISRCGLPNKIVTLCNKNRQPAAKNQNRSFTSRGATVGVGLRL